MGIFILFLLFGRQNTLSVASSEEIPTDVTVEQVVLADNEFVKISTSSLYKDEYLLNYILELEVENKTNKDIYLYSDLSAVNHYMIGTYIMDEEVKANSIKSFNVTFPADELVAYNITEIGLVEFDISVEAAERGFGVQREVLVDLYKLNTKTDKYENMTESLNVEGFNMMNDAGIKLTLTNPEDILTSPNNVMIFMENNTEQPYYFLFTQFRNKDSELYD